MRSSPRAAVAAAFLIHSTVSGTWAPRLPAIKESLELSDGELGTALVGLAIGLVVGTRVAGAPIDRFGSRPVMRAGFPLLAGTLLLPGLAESGITARALQAGRTETLGLITDDLEGRFSIPILMGAEDAAGAGRMSVFMTSHFSGSR